MGVSIHYRGRLDNPDQLPEFCEKLKSIASGLNWHYQILDDDWNIPVNAILIHRGKRAEIRGHLGLRGIGLKPSEESESIDFFFDAKGFLLSPMNIILIQEGVLAIDDAWITVKTQFMSAETHAMIIGLLNYIKEHYIPNLEVKDEGEYWETGDYRILEDKMRLIKEKIDYLSHELSSKDLGDLSLDEIATEIERLFHAEDVTSRYIN